MEGQERPPPRMSRRVLDTRRHKLITSSKTGCRRTHAYDGLIALFANAGVGSRLDRIGWSVSANLQLIWSPRNRSGLLE